jgi:LysR family transcriptional regulator, hydrogen peroxide-inducible genes activator
MDFNQVRYFLALANTLNFTKAAEQCYVTQPALTQAIKRLETELGGELLRRDGRDTELTELGKSLRTHFEQIDRTRHMVRTTAKAVMEGEIAELNIGIMCTIGPHIIAGLLDTFLMNHPKVSIILHDVIPASIPELILSGALDGAFFARHHAPHPQLRHVELFQEDMVITFHSGHAFSKNKTVPLFEIANERYVERLHCEFREEFQNFYIEKGLDLNVVFRCEREDWIQSIVREGMGVSLIPRYSLLRSDLEHRRVSNPPLSRTVEFVTANHDTPKPVLNLFIEQVKNYTWPVTEFDR